MPRIINAYDGNSAVGDSLAKLGEAIYGDQAKNEVYRQKAFGSKRENDNIPLLADAVARGDRDAIARFGVMSNKTGQDTGDFNRLGVSNHAAGVDDPRLALATMGAGGAFTSTAPGQGRALANDRSIAGAHDATSLTIGDRLNARALEDRRLQSENNITTTGMNNETSRAVGEGNNQASRDVAGIQGENQHRTQLDIDGRTLVAVDDGNGGYKFEKKSNAAGMGAPMTTDQVKAGVISEALRRARTTQQPQAFPAEGTAPYNPVGPQAQPQQSAAAPAPQGGGDIFRHLTPQVRNLVGVNTETPMINPQDGRTGVSRDSGSTLESGQPATGYVPSSNEAVLAQERDNNVRRQAGTALPPAPNVYPDSAKDAALTSGGKAAAQTIVNHTGGFLGIGEAVPEMNRARERLQNQAQATRELIASAPGRAAVMDKKWADSLIPQPGFMGMTGINADEQKNRSVQLTDHLREMYGIVQQDAVNPNTPPAERVKMEAYLRNLGHAIQLREKVTPDAPAPQPNGSRVNAPNAAPAAAAPAGKPPTVVQNGHTYNLQPDGSYQ